ncbi:transglutaminase family protein [Verrucomicrobiota bacterium sgz303538]
MSELAASDSFKTLADAITERLHKCGVRLTIGGEPSYVPIDPQGAEWNVTAIGPTKLSYGYELARALIEQAIPGAVAFFSPGKCYPGEVNPRWAIHLVWNRDGSRMTSVSGTRTSAEIAPEALRELRQDILSRLKLRGQWQQAYDYNDRRGQVWVLPLDHDGKKWRTEKWTFQSSGKLVLLNAEGPAGLRLPLADLAPEVTKRALVLEVKEEGLHIFFPPLLQSIFLHLLKMVSAALRKAKIGQFFYEGYVPSDDADIWSKLSITADPGVLEINLPPCGGAREYGWWMEQLEKCGAAVGLRSFKQPSLEERLGTGGGNHILFGGPSLDENPFFRRPRWVTSLLRYWQHHPSLSYLFTGSYVGPSSQAPRPDESAGQLYDLEMAYQFLEKLEPGEDHRHLISETLRHLHIDRSGNTHRSEVSFDKFWNVGWEGGCRGLIEFRAVESLPHAHWMSAVALLWTALAVFLLEKGYSHSLVDHGIRLHDTYFLPTPLWADFESALRDLRQAGLRLPVEPYREIWEYRFPKMLTFARDRARLTVRKALEGWPLLCETPLEGGNTSRYVDTSIERLEFTANESFTARYRVLVQGRELKLGKYPGKQRGAGLRYRRSALHPSLHPGIAPHVPLYVQIVEHTQRQVAAFQLNANRRIFEPATCDSVPPLAEPCNKLDPDFLTYDLRIP